MDKERRDFLKITTAGAAGLALLRSDRAFADWPATGKLEINPNISNMRVVACYDPKMMKSTPTAMSFAAENAAVDAATVQANMDAMAMQLANQPTADAAWKAIFRSSKAWAATKVAIKVNVIEPKNAARVAVIEKFCRVFSGFGVPAANIIIYDGNGAYGSGTSYYNSYFSSTDATKIPGVVSKYNDALSGTMKAPVPGDAAQDCTKDIANGTIDILVNIANNKGHSMMGGATLSMKNHFGTFAPAKHENGYVFNINKSDAILGGDPVRQQLCFIDSLIANKASNQGTPEAMPCYLVMGVFGPAVDYLTVKKVREEVMGCKHDAGTINSYLTTFGYTAADPVWVLVPAGWTSPVVDAGPGGSGSGSGGSSGTGGSNVGSSSATGGVGAGSGGNAGAGNSGSGRGGAPASGGGVGGGGASSSAGGSGGTRTSPLSAAGGSATSGGTNGGTGAPQSSGSGCDVVGLGRRGGPLGAILALGTVVAAKVWRRAPQVESGDQKGAGGSGQAKDETGEPLP